MLSELEQTGGSTQFSWELPENQELCSQGLREEVGGFSQGLEIHIRFWSSSEEASILVLLNSSGDVFDFGFSGLPIIVSTSNFLPFS